MSIVRHYTVVLVPCAGDRWRAYFPDLPSCNIERSCAENAITHARDAASAAIAELGGAEVPRPPRSFGDVRRWGRERSIDWTTAVISCVDVPSTGSPNIT